MAVVATYTRFGVVFTCTGGTAVAALVIPKGEPLRVTGVHFAGDATTDIITVFDGDGNLFAKSPTGTGNTSVTFAKPVHLDGVMVAASGATTGAAVLYTE